MPKAILIEHGKLRVLDDAEPNNLQWLQKQVGGLIETVERSVGIDVYGNEEANITDPPLYANVVRVDGEILSGPLVVVGHDGPNQRGLTDSEISRVQLVTFPGWLLPVLHLYPTTRGEAA